MSTTRMFFAILSLVFVSIAPARAFDVPRADSSTVRVAAATGKGSDEAPELVGCCATGSGFVIAPDFIATNHHVIDPADFAEELKKTPGTRVVYFVRVAGSTKNFFARVVWSSAELDLAVLQVSKLEKPPLAMADHAMLEYPRRGQRVVAIGYPGIADSLLKTKEAIATSTVSQGIVAKIVPAPMGGTTRPVIQHDAAINKGNSGGPLFDACGTVVGINTFGANTVLDVKKDKDGNVIAHGTTPAGIYFSPHIGNLIASVRSVPALASIRLSTTTQACSDESAVPLAVYVGMGAIGLMTMATAFFALTRRREVVRVVESYSAWKHRRGVATGTPRTNAVRANSASTGAPPARRGDAPVADAARGSDDWALTGRGAQGEAMRVAITAVELKKAIVGTEKGIVLGRSASLCDKVIPGNDAGVSRRHCKLALGADGTLTCEDLKSAYGTKINGVPLVPFEPAPIAAGDRLTLGETTLTFDRAK